MASTTCFLDANDAWGWLPGEETQSTAAASELGSAELGFEELCGVERASGRRSSAGGELAIAAAGAMEAIESAATQKRPTATGKAADSDDEMGKTSRGRAEASQTVAPPAGTSKTRCTRQTEATKVAHDGETTRRGCPSQPQRVPDQANERREARRPWSAKSAPGAELPRRTAGAARTASTESAVPSTWAAIGLKAPRVAGS